MKRSLLVVWTLLLFQASSPGQGMISFGVFYSSLDPYGEWIPLDAGVYGWRPVHTAGDWRPYMMGRWAWTYDGWYWVSDEPWGWATYHYGRWYFDDFYGWIWIPGYDWAPAWVEWRYGGDYIGWAPLGPYATWEFQFGIRYRHRWATPAHWWAFVDCRHMNSHSLHRYVSRTEENSRYIGRTRGAGDVRYTDGRIQTRGPEREFVERRGHIRLQQADLFDVKERGERVTREGDRDRIEVYRPRIEERRMDVMEKPGRIRESGRRLGLDAGKIDLRARLVDGSTGRSAEKPRILGRPERDGQREMQRAEEPRREERVRPVPPKEPEVSRGKEERVRDHAVSDIQRTRPPREEMRSKPVERPTSKPSEERSERGRGDIGGREKR
jgi:hypothetical protein